MRARRKDLRPGCHIERVAPDPAPGFLPCVPSASQAPTGLRSGGSKSLCAHPTEPIRSGARHKSKGNHSYEKP
jgi:hypothetical protein